MLAQLSLSNCSLTAAVSRLALPWPWAVVDSPDALADGLGEGLGDGLGDAVAEALGFGEALAFGAAARRFALVLRPLVPEPVPGAPRADDDLLGVGAGVGEADGVGVADGVAALAKLGAVSSTCRNRS